ncbi:MAG: PAS domain S-box protein [Burkholderiales bacterium]|nr:PAS domain S-box protein [Burkholderiales bacterium]
MTVPPSSTSPTPPAERGHIADPDAPASPTRGVSASGTNPAATRTDPVERRSRLRDMGLRGRLYLLLAVTVLPVLLLIGLRLIAEWHEDRELADAAVRGGATNVSEAFARHQAAARALLALLGGADPVAADPRGAERLSRVLANQPESIRFLAFVDRASNVWMLRRDSTALIRLHASAFPASAVLAAPDGPALLTGPVGDPVDGQPALLASRGGIIVGTHVDSLMRTLGEASRMKGARVTLLFPPFEDSSGQSGNVVERVQLSGRPGASLRVVQPTAGESWRLQLDVPASDAQAASRQRLTGVYLLPMLLALLLGVGLGARLVRTHHAEVRRLRDQVNAFADEEVAERRPLGLSGELGELEEAFLRMATRIEAQRDELRSDRELYLRLSRGAADWVWEQDAEFRFTRFQYLIDEDNFDTNPHEVIGKRRWDLDYDNLTPEMWEEHIATLRAHKPFRNLILQRRQADGSPHVVRVSGSPKFDARGQFIGYRGTGADITKAFQAESAVEVAKQRLVAALESAGHGVWDWDLGKNRFYRSGTWGRMLGLGLDVDLHSPDLATTLMHPDDVQSAEAALSAHVDGRTRNYSAEFRMRHADGGWRWILDRGMAIEFNPDGSPSRMIGTHTDVTEQKGIALALRDSEARLQLILDHAPNVAIQGYDEFGKVTYWNQPAERIFGWTAEEAAGRTLDQLFLTPDQAQQFRAELDAIAGTGRVIGPDETLVHDKSGLQRWILSNLFEIPTSGDGTRFICMDVDITDTKRAEIMHAESEAQLSSIFQNAAMPTMIVDIETRAIMRVNKAFERVLEIPAEAAMGHVLAEFGVWEDPSTPDRIYAELARSGTVRGMEVRLSMPSRRKADMLVFADVVTLAGRSAVIAQALDITDENLARAKLDEATRWARALVDYSPTMMLLSRWPDGEIVEINDRACEIYEYSREEIIGSSTLKLGTWADPDERARAVAGLRERGRLAGFGMTVRTRSGELRKLNLYTELIVMDGEQFALSQAVDVTELSDTQKALAESEQRMKTIFTHGPVPMVLAEVDSQAIIQVNPALERVLGLRNDQLVGRNLAELGIWNSLEDRQRMYEQLAKSGRIENMETRFNAPTGEVLDYQLSVEVIPYGGRRAIIAHGYDVTANRRALNEAERSRRWFRTLFEQSPISMTILDLQGKTILANAAFSRMYGLPLEQVIGRTSVQNNLWVDPTDRDRLWAALQESGSIRDVVLSRKRADGRPLHVLAYMDKFDIDGENYYIIQGIDVTRAQESERALRALTALNSAAFNAVGESIVVHDRTGQVILVNAMAERVLGATGRAPIAATLLEPEFRWCGLDGALSAASSLPFRVARESGKPVREQVIGLQLPIAAHQYDTRWFSVSCEPIDQDGDGVLEGTVTSFFDITDRIRAEAELRVLLDRLQLQLERMPIACFLTDEAFNILYWNPASERTFGYSTEEIIGRSADLLTPVELRETVRALSRGALGHAAGVDFRNENLTRDGRHITCEWRSNSLYGADGKFVATMHMAIDMTNVIDSQRRLERLNEELEQRVALRTQELSTTVRELEQFSYTVAHDLRAPLRALDGYSFLLAEGGPESDAFLAKIRANVAHMTGLIDGLLNYGRIGRQALQRQPVNMMRLCEVVVADVKHAFPKAHIDIGPMDSVLGDENLLRQVWTNLVSNACKFSSRGADSRVQLWCEHTGEGATRFLVQDNGVGFDMKYAGKLFGVFERLHRQDDFSGSGIGLSIVKRIIERHGGKVGVHSADGQGATFWFELPVTAQRVDSAGQAAPD